MAEYLGSLQSLLPHQFVLIIQHVYYNLLQILHFHVIPEYPQALYADYPHLMKLILQHLQEKSLNKRHFLHQLLFLNHQRHHLPKRLLPISFSLFRKRSKFLESLQSRNPRLEMKRPHFSRQKGNDGVYKIRLIFIQKAHQAGQLPQYIMRKRQVVQFSPQLYHIDQKCIGNVRVVRTGDEVLQEVNGCRLLGVQYDRRLLLNEGGDLRVLRTQCKNHTDKLPIKLVLAQKIFRQQQLLQLGLGTRTRTGLEQFTPWAIRHPNNYIIDSTQTPTHVFCMPMHRNERHSGE